MGVAVRRDVDVLRAGLSRWLDRPVGVVARPAAGFSCETLVVDGELVVRLPPAGDGIFPAYDLAQQVAAQEAAATAGVPVASPARYEPDPSFLGAPFVAMPFVAGVVPRDFTPSDPWLTGLPSDDARRQVWRSFVDTIVRIHGADASGLGLRAGLGEELRFWEDYVAWASDGAPPAALADVLAWCRASAPDMDRIAGGLLWGDVRLGNVVFDAEGLAPKAVLDWDMVSTGPVEMDVAWFLALERLQTDLTGMRVSGFGSRDETVAAVEAGVGRPLVDLEWFEVFALARASAVSTRIALLRERAGKPPALGPGEDPLLAAAVARIDAAPSG